MVPFLEQPFDVFAYEVGLEIDGIMDLLQSERRHLGGVRNDRNAEGMSRNLVNSETDTVHCDGTLRHAILQDLRRRFDSENNCVAFLTPVTDGSDTIHGAGH